MRVLFNQTTPKSIGGHVFYDPAEQKEIAKAPPEEDDGAIMIWLLTRFFLAVALVTVLAMVAGKVL